MEALKRSFGKKSLRLVLVFRRKMRVFWDFLVSLGFGTTANGEKTVEFWAEQWFFGTMTVVLETEEHLVRGKREWEC